MHSTASRRAGGGLFTFLSGPACKAADRRACSRRNAPNIYTFVAARPANSQHRQISTTRVQLQSPIAPPPRTTTTPTIPPAAPTKPLSTPPATQPSEPAHRSLTDGLSDPPPTLNEDEKQVDWTRSFHGLSSIAFTPEQAQILMAPIASDDIEIKPDGILYLPEIKYRRILNRAFGPGGWGLAPRGETIVTGKLVTREYGLVCHGRLVSIARGEQQYFDPDGIPTATEGCKSNALMRCCKDLGVASELWDPRFIRRFMAGNIREMMVEHMMTKKRRKHFMRKDDELKYPWKEVPAPGAAPATAFKR